MPFLEPIDSGDLTRLRTGGYRASGYMAYCPQTVVFRARANEGIASGVFAEIDFTSVDVGAYTDVKEGMTVYLSQSTSIRSAYHVGRIRKAATSSTLYISESAVVVQPNHYIIVVNDYWLHEILGRIAEDGTIYADYDKSFQTLKPLIYNLQSAYINPVATGDAEFDFAPLAAAMQDGATIDEWLWDVDDGTITAGADDEQNITVEFPQGERWVRLTVTDSEGVSNFFVFWVCVGLTYIIDNIEEPEIPAELGAGYNATVTTFYTAQTTLLKSLPDQTLCVLFSKEIFGDGSTTPILTNIDFIGRIRQESAQTTGDEQHGQLQTGTFQIEGFGAQLARLSSPQMSVEDSAAPSKYGQITKPTPPRIIGYLCSVFNTLSNICALSFGEDDNDFITKNLTLQTTSAGQSIAEMANYINAKMNFAPSGEMTIRRQAIYLDSSAKAALDTIAHVTLEDMLSFSIERDYFKSVGQSIGAGEVYSTTAATIAYYKGAAPQTARGNGEGITTQDGQILTADIDEFEANVEIATRVAALYADSQPVDKLDVVFYDSWRNLLIPTCYQWWTFDIPSADNHRGLVYNENTRWILMASGQSVAIADGLRGIQATFRREPLTGTAQVMASIIPQVTASPDPVLPPVNPYSGFPPDPLLYMPSDDPTEQDRARRPGGGFSPFSPLPPDQAAAAEDEAGNIGCKVLNVFFSNSASVYTGFLTQNGSPYVITVTGDAQLGNGVWEHTFDFTVDDGGFVNTDVSAATPGNQFAGTWVSGTGWIQTAVNVDSPSRTSNGIGIAITFSSATITEIELRYSATEGGSGGGATYGARILGTGFDTGAVDGSRFGTDQTLTATPPAGTYTTFTLFSSVDVIAGHSQPATGTATYTSVTVRGTGTNPFTGLEASEVRGDAFYYGYDSGSPQAYDSSQGLRIDGAPVGTIPTYNSNHEYTIVKTGTGNQFQFNFQDFDYSDNDNVPLRIEVCGENADA